MLPLLLLRLYCDDNCDGDNGTSTRQNCDATANEVMFVLHGF